MSEAEKVDTKYFMDRWVNLADERIGARAISCTDDFFAPVDNLLKPGRGIFIPDKYTENGKWMDGWESRRRRQPGNDSCIIRLGCPGQIYGVDIDTNHFLGNHPPFASLEACHSAGDPNDSTKWETIVPKSPLGPGQQNPFEVTSDKVFTHVRLQIYPDGGVARLRVYGDVRVDWTSIDTTREVDLASVLNGGKVVNCNDMFFGSKDNLIYPGRGINMGDGWETKRRREPGNDWVIVAFGAQGRVDRVEVDTAHFKGNFPESCSVEGANLEVGDSSDLSNVEWKCLLDRSPLQADYIHEFENLNDIGPITHIRFQIYPDGGVSRLRCWGRLQ